MKRLIRDALALIGGAWVLLTLAGTALRLLGCG